MNPLAAFPRRPGISSVRRLAPLFQPLRREARTISFVLPFASSRSLARGAGIGKPATGDTFMRILLTAVIVCGEVAVFAASGHAADTRMLSQPAVSDSHVAFVYAEDLWVAGRDGKNVRRLTSHEGVEFNPRFSPDGRTLAFSAQYDGNTDVFVVPVRGGAPRRLTWHPGSDVVRDFTPEGDAVLFSSAREVYTGRHVQLFTIPVVGGHPQKLDIPHGFKASYSADGSKIAYTPLYEPFRQWKNYRGGTATRIWIYDVATAAIEMIPQPEGRCNDTEPMWVDGHVYFLSDRAGEFNLFAYDPRDDSLEQKTQYEDFPILSASAGDTTVAFEQAGWLHLYDVPSGDSRRLPIEIATDHNERRPRYVDGKDWVRNGHLSPSGARAVLEVRGDIVTVPAKKGEPRNLTNTPDAHERSPVWSPDGKWIAWFSDASGEYELHVARQDGSGNTRKFELSGAGFYDAPQWSPDSKKLSYLDNSWSLAWIDLDTGDTRKVSSEPLYGPIRSSSHAWSPCSRWLVYTRTTHAYFQQVHLYSLDEDQSYPLTDGLTDVGEPCFDASGKYLYFSASTDAGPVRAWFAMSNADMEMTNSLYVAVLEKGEPSPLAPQSDEEEVEDEGEEGGDEAKPDPAESKDSGAGGEEDGETSEAIEGDQLASAETEEDADEPSESEDTDDEGDDSERTKIDRDGFDQRILALPVGGGYLSSLQAGEEGFVYYTKNESSSLFGRKGTPALYRFNLKERKEEKIADGVPGYAVSATGKKLLVFQGGELSIIPASPGANPASQRLPTQKIQIKIDPPAEWAQIYHEAWRINRDYFYDPGMHGADWPAMREKYAAFLPHLATRSDLNRVIQWMCSELAVGHHRVGGGDRRLDGPDRVSGGLLGADFTVEEGRYRFTKVFGGLNWNPSLRSPLTEPGVEVEPGDYLITVQGRDLRFPDNLFQAFENTAGKSIEITVAKDADGEDSRTVTVVPVRSEYGLRNRDWVEGNMRRVHEATDGRVAYVYVPNTTAQGHTYFKRYFFPQADKQAIIIDERHNGGGQVADYYIDHLRRPALCQWATRYGDDIPTPFSSIQGPKVMIIDETAGSGGDLLPWMFRELDLGVLVGRPTWGGLVGVLGFPVLMDGGSVSAPNLAIWTEDGFIVENVGVPPDIEVEQLPSEIIAGRDPQLEKAIEVTLEMLEKDPPKKAVRPPFPIRVRR